MSVDGQVARLGVRQYGLLSSEQLDKLGMTRGMRRQRVEDRRLRRVRKFVYIIAGVPPSWPQAVMAAVLAAGPDAVASGVTAGALWGLKHCDQRAKGGSIHITAPHQLRLAGVTGHLRRLGPGHRMSRSGIPVTSPEWTVLDLAATLTAAELGECVDDALRHGLIRLYRLRELADRAKRSGWRRLGALHEVLADRIPGYDAGDSDWERDMDRLWEAWGLPRSVRQYRVRANGHTYVLDRAIPQLRVGIEWNGFETHGTRSGFDHDSDKRADLTAAGWHMLDFTTRSTPERVCNAVLAAVSQRQNP